MHDYYQLALKIWKMVFLETSYEEHDLGTLRSVPLSHTNIQLDQNVQINQPWIFWLNDKNIHCIATLDNVKN